MHWTEWVALTASAGAVGVAVYAAMARSMRQVVAEKQQVTDRQLSAMSATVSALQARVAELGRLQAEQAEREATKTVDSAGEKRGAPESETAAVLIAAATTFLGRKALVRRAGMEAGGRESADAWAQQGRANVQTSHNPRARG
jgi:hypothetical protein